MQQVISLLLQRASLGREGLGHNWKQRMLTNCSWLLSKLQTMFECFYKNIFTSKVSHSLDIKAQPKTLQPGYAKAYFLSYKQS